MPIVNNANLTGENQMNKSLVIITGATSGIGLQTAVEFSKAGHPLLLLGRNTDKLEKLN